MNKLLSILSAFVLLGCQTLGFVEVDPRAPTKLDLSYPNFLNEVWSKSNSRPLINFGSSGNKYAKNHQFQVSAGSIYKIKNNAAEEYDIENGTLLNSIALEGAEIVSGVTIGYNTLVYSDSDGTIYAFDLNTNALRWQQDLKDLVISKVLITSRFIFAQTSSDVLYAFNLRDGEIIWTKSAQAPLLSIRGTAVPYFYEGLVFASFSNGRLAAIRSLDGIQLWEKPISVLKGTTELEKLMDSDTSAVAFQESIYVANFNGSLTRFDIRTGDKLFSVDFSTSEPLVLFRDLVIGISSDDEIIAYDAINGSERWINDQYKFRDLSSLVLYNNKLYFGDLDGFLHSVSAESGETLGVKRTNLDEVKQIEVVSNTLAVQDQAGKLKVYKTF